MPDWYSLLRPPYTYLLMGGVFFSMAVYSTFAGRTSARFSWVYRAKEPISFWVLVALYYFGGVLFIGIFLYQVDAISKGTSP
jgi:hypothetical protein